MHCVKIISIIGGLFLLLKLCNISRLILHSHQAVWLCSIDRKSLLMRLYTLRIYIFTFVSVLMFWCITYLELYRTIIWWQCVGGDGSVWKCSTWTVTGHQASATSYCTGTWIIVSFDIYKVLTLKKLILCSFFRN